MLWISWNSASARIASSPRLPRRRPRMYRASCSRLALTSHRGDSGRNQTAANSTRRKMIWKATGNRQRNADRPPSIKDRPLSIGLATSSQDGSIGQDIQFQPVCKDNTEDVQGELNGNKLSPGRMVRNLCGPNGDNGVEDTSANAINQTC